MMAGTDILRIPYKGSGQALPDLRSGQVTVSFNAAGVVVTYIKAGKLRALRQGCEDRRHTHRLT